jgi:hypothetical protein
MNLTFISVDAQLPVKLNISPFEQLVSFFLGTMSEPTLYGWFHFLSLTFLLILCILVISNRRKGTEKSLRLTLGVTSAVMLAFELYKQIVSAYTPETDVWAYSWPSFPFQFCSTPMYVMLLAALVKPGKFRDGLLAFLATYSLVAGGGVMLYPATVFTETIGINIQTMLHHGAMVVIAVYLLSSGLIKFEFNTVLKGAFPVFLTLVGMAITMNFLFDKFGDGSDFNMFYIAPGKDFLLPILEKIFSGLPHFVYFFSYLFFFSLGAYLVLLLAKSCENAYHLAKEKISDKKI